MRGREAMTHRRRSRRPDLVRLSVAIALITAVVAPALPASAAPTWSVVASPSPVGPPSGILKSVACPSTDRCFAVGYYGPDGTNTKTLIERWNGTSWSVMASPNPAGASDSLLTGVSCPSPTSCYAVGWSTDSSLDEKTLVEHWNGTSWSIVTSPNPAGSTGSFLNSVSCPSTTSCYAVGFSYSSFAQRTLVERWNG